MAFAPRSSVLCSVAGDDHGSPDAVNPPGAPTLRINPISGSGTATLRLQNSQTKPITVVLTGVPASGNLPRDVRVTFAGEGAAKGELSLATTLQPQSIQRVVMNVERVTEPCDYSIDLFSGTTKIGAVTIRRSALGLSVETPPVPIRLKPGSASTRRSPSHERR